MKKKLAAIAMATAMAASLAACSSKPAETTAAAEENEETTAEAAEGSEAAEAGDSAFAGIINTLCSSVKLGGEKNTLYKCFYLLIFATDNNQ